MTDKSTNLMIFPNFPLYSMLKNTTSSNANKTLSDPEKEELYSLLLKLTKKEPVKNSKVKGSLVFVPPEKKNKDDDSPISLLDDTSHYDDKEIVYALIKAYSIDVDNIDSEFPYDAKNSKLGLKYDLDVLPTHLQHILLSFLKLDKT
jgi:hypothetical protein